MHLKAAYTTPLSKKRSYIYDHGAAMDICQHPEIMPIHGFTSAEGTNPGPLVPLFTFAKTNIHSDVLVTPLEQYSDTYIGYDPDWEKKDFNKLMWRGSTTGVNFYVTNDWKASQRARLHFLTHESKGARNLLVADADGPVSEEPTPIRSLNEAYMDVSFSGGPVQCDDETCAIMKDVIDFKETMGLHDSYKVSSPSSLRRDPSLMTLLISQYKYVMGELRNLLELNCRLTPLAFTDVDGNGWSGRFHRWMSMKACVFKSTLFPEWYGDRIQPWVQ